jgi:hypothetical protein
MKNLPILLISFVSLNTFSQVLPGQSLLSKELLLFSEEYNLPEVETPVYYQNLRSGFKSSDNEVLDSILITDYSSNYPENVDTVAKVEYGYYNNLKLKNSTEFYWNPGYSIWYKGHDRYYSYYQDGLLSELNTYYWRDNDIYQKRKKEYSYNNKNLLIEEKITRIKPQYGDTTISKYTFEYDNIDSLSLHAWYFYDKETDKWGVTTNTYYEYDTIEQTKQSTTYRYITDLDTLVKDSYTVYSDFRNNNYCLDTTYKWSNSDSVFYASHYSTREYDALGRIREVVNYKLDIESKEWEIRLKTLNFYNGVGKLFKQELTADSTNFNEFLYYYSEYNPTPVCVDTDSILEIETCADSLISPSGNHIWKVSGIYTDVIPNAGGCDSTLTIYLNFLYCGTTTTPRQQKQYSVYPNPVVNGEASILFNALPKQVEIAIINLSGKVVYSGSPYSLFKNRLRFKSRKGYVLTKGKCGQLCYY